MTFSPGMKFASSAQRKVLETNQGRFPYEFGQLKYDTFEQLAWLEVFCFLSIRGCYSFLKLKIIMKITLSYTPVQLKFVPRISDKKAFTWES